MKKRQQQLTSDKQFLYLSSVRALCKTGKLTSLQNLHQPFNLHICHGTILRSTGVVKKNQDGVYEWIAGKVTPKLAEKIRQRASNYTNNLWY